MFGVDAVAVATFDHRVKFADGSQGYADCTGAAGSVYDALGRPATRNADAFGYNARSEVTSLTREGYWPQSYAYDEIGNSTWYSANSLNQYAEFAHDLDGNMITNYNIVMTYDAQSRLDSVSRRVYTNGAWRAELLVSNRYDHIGRRVKKTTPVATHTLFYDGWNLIEERVAHTSGANTIIRYYWGKDLSGTLQGAGGVGGLLYLTVSTSNVEHQTSNSQLFIPCYDNNGNITRYLDSNGATVAQYTYDAFGNLLDKSGPMCDMFRHRFSTKYYDIESGLYYYGYRYYSPVLMRWINRDPIEEGGGINLYAASENNLLNSWDMIGLWSATWASRGEKRRVYKKEKGDTIKGLSDKIGMDERTFHVWARIETAGRASKNKHGKAAPSSDDGLKIVCYISVPNVWIEADLLRGGGIYDRLIVNQGGTIGSFFGQTLGRWGYHTLKPETPSDLLKTVNADKIDIYGLTVYAHGSPNGYIVAPDRKSAIHQMRLINAFRSNGYRIAKANMMQCYSIKPDGTIPTGPTTEKKFNYKEAWEKTAVKVYGYEGVNAIGIDFK